MRPWPRCLVTSCLSVVLSPWLSAVDVSGSVAADVRLYAHDGSESDQNYRTDWSGVAKLTLFQHWDDERQSFRLVPFARLDQRDHQRTHADVRECLWTYAESHWDVSVGVGKVFWGVTESEHLVDIINQTDLVEDPAGEEKLGQPLMAVAASGVWGSGKIFVLPYFRERTFPGVDGRLRSSPHVDVDHPLFEVSDRREHLDVAARWSRALKNWDVGLSAFRGIGREPRLVFAFDDQSRPVLLPEYHLITQFGADVQVTWENVLGKLEVIHRTEHDTSFTAAVGGVETTFVGVLGAVDVGLLTEYLYDSRGHQATTPFADDIYVGLRVVGNDEHSSELLVGATVDRKDHAQVIRVTGSRRLGHALRVNLTGWSFVNIPQQSQLAGFAQDDVIQLGLEWFF